MSTTALATHLDETVRLARSGALWSYIATVAWLIIGIDSIVRPAQDNRRDAAWFLCFIPFMAVFWYVGRVQQQRQSKFERVTFWTLIFVSLLAMIGQLGNVFEIKPLQVLGFPLGAILWMLGMIVYGIATWRLRLLPWYAALALILWEPGSIATGLLLAPISPLHDRGGYSAGVEKGIATLIIGLGLLAYARRREHQQP